MLQSEIRIECSRRGILQTFRAMQAVSEAGFRVLVPEYELARWEFAARWFDLPYGLDDERAPTLRLGIDHESPEVSLGALTRPLIYPLAVLNAFYDRQGEKTVDVSFAGYVTRSRRRALERWRSANSTHRWGAWRRQRFANQVVIEDTRRGRSWPTKAWDPDYAMLLNRSRFVLCPDGDFVWTYRFFEAVAAGAIPIIENFCPQYDGFNFRRMTDPLNSLEWSMLETQENLQRLRELTTVNGDDLRQAVDNALRR